MIKIEDSQERAPNKRMRILAEGGMYHVVSMVQLLRWTISVNVDIYISTRKEDLHGLMSHMGPHVERMT